MGRTVQTFAVPGAPTTAGLTSAQVLALIRANTGYEYINTIKLTTSEVSSFDITGLDSSIYSGFRIVSNRLGYGGSTSQSTWTMQVITGSGTVDTANNYEMQGIKLANASGFFTGNSTGWNISGGWGGPPAIADFWLDYNINSGATFDADIWFQVTNSKSGGYSPAGGILTGIHTSTGATPTGIRISTSQNFRAITDNAYITVMGLRIKA